MSETERMRHSILALRQSIENTEKIYKEASIMSRTVAHTPLGNFEIPRNGAEEALRAELIMGANNELVRVSNQRRARNEQKARAVASFSKLVAQNLEKQIADTKKRFREQERLIKSGPEFHRHFYCIFGEIVNVTGLMDNAYAVFSSENSLGEKTLCQSDVLLKYTDTDSDREPNKLCKLLQIDMDRIVHVQHLYTESISAVDDGPEQQETVPSFSFAPTGGDAASGMRSNDNTTNTSDAKINGATDAQIQNPAGGKQTPPKQESTPPRESNSPQSPQVETSEGGNFIPFSNSIAPEKILKYKQTSPRKLLRSENLRPKEIADLAEMEKLLAAEDFALLKEHIGLMRFHSMFFIGTITGEAAIAEILWTIDDVTKKTEFSFSVIKQKRLSYIPLALSNFHKLEDGTPQIVAEIATVTGEHLLQGFNMALDMEWTCKCDLLHLTSIDRLNRVVPQDVFETTGRRLDDFRNVEQLAVTAMCFDEHHKCLVVALRDGCCIRVIYKREANGEPNLSESLSYTVVPSRRISAVVPESARGSISGPSGLQGPGFKLSSIAESDFSTSNFGPSLKLTWCLDVTGIKYVVSHRNNKPQLIVAGNDGIVRVFPDDIAKVLSRPLYEVNFNKSVRTPVGFDTQEMLQNGVPTVPFLDIITNQSAQFLVVYTSKSKLAAVDPAFVQTSMVEMNVVSNRQGVLRQCDAPRKPSANAVRQIKIVDDDAGTAVIFHGREWSIVSFERLIKWTEASRAH
nr:hypothetical protein HK105_003932 [Polyrhizophydium stewartii]